MGIDMFGWFKGVLTPRRRMQLDSRCQERFDRGEIFAFLDHRGLTVIVDVAAALHRFTTELGPGWMRSLGGGVGDEVIRGRDAVEVATNEPERVAEIGVRLADAVSVAFNIEPDPRFTVMDRLNLFVRFMRHATTNSK